MAGERNDEVVAPAAAEPAGRPIWVTPELEKLNIWSDTLGSNVALLGDNSLTRLTPLS
jgi:hypothetical protein